MKKTILFIIITLISIGAIMFVIISSRDSSVSGINDIGLDIEGSDVDLNNINIENRGEVSTVTNKTSGYSITIPNDWKVKVQPRTLKLHIPTDTPLESLCSLMTASLDDEGEALEDFIARTTEDVRNERWKEVRDFDLTETRGNTGTLLQVLDNGKIERESAYFQSGSYIYILTSYYGIVEGEVSAFKPDYNTCHPLFEDLLSTLTIN